MGIVEFHFCQHDDEEWRNYYGHIIYMMIKSNLIKKCIKMYCTCNNINLTMLYVIKETIYITVQF